MPMDSWDGELLSSRNAKHVAFMSISQSIKSFSLINHNRLLLLLLFAAVDDGGASMSSSDVIFRVFIVVFEREEGGEWDVEGVIESSPHWNTCKRNVIQVRKFCL